MRTSYLAALASALWMLFAGTAAAYDGEQQAAEAAPASAESSGGASLGLLLGYGTDLEEGDLNLFGLGLGVRGGYTLDMGLYLGAQFIYFLGESEGAEGAEVSANEMLIGAEVGYDADIDPIVIRPSLGLGLAITSMDMELPPAAAGFVSDADMSSEDFYIAPGASVIYPIDGFFVGADLRFYLIFAEETVEALTMMLNGGINL